MLIKEEANQTHVRYSQYNVKLTESQNCYEELILLHV